MNRFKSKKGFTLAELLIVVAIIAVLVAIAVPLFVGAIQKAEKATFEANQRTIKGMGVAALLSSEKEDLDLTDTSKTYYAYATIDANGDIQDLAVTDALPATAFETYETWKADKTKAIAAKITPTDIGEYTKTPVGP